MQTKIKGRTAKVKESKNNGKISRIVECNIGKKGKRTLIKEDSLEKTA